MTKRTRGLERGKLITPSQTNVAPWCYKWIRLGCIGIGFLGGVMYKATYSAKNGLNLTKILFREKCGA